VKGTMEAVVMRGPRDVVVEEKPIPQIEPDEVLVKFKAAGICHSDIEFLEGNFGIRFPYPVTPGHEWAGQIVEVGGDVATFAEGDRVVGECKQACGECVICKSGSGAQCPNAYIVGLSGDGAFSEYFKAKARFLHKLPDSMGWELGALAEPFSVGYFSLCVAGGTDGGERVVVFGGGTIGSCIVAAARGMDATVIGVEPVTQRRDLLRTMGADYTLDPNAAGFMGELLSLTGGIGADLAFEASGHATALQVILTTVRNGGRVVFTGINMDRSIPVELGVIQAKGLDVKGADGSMDVWPRMLQFMTRVKPNLEALITHRFRLSQAREAYEMATNFSEAVKVLFVSDDLMA
jgi:L-iditol 2-dehydrogenase